jgi:hypothetical protein
MDFKTPSLKIPEFAVVIFVLLKSTEVILQPRNAFSPML